jgi:DNA invertase Pin-like site-specific DNA recombinase
MKKYISYLRVSTKKQGKSGLGLEAQRAIIEHFAKMDGAVIEREFIETESGKDTINRQYLKEAIELCNTGNYTLIVAKLDRLSRDVKDTFEILEQLKGKLISCDIPTQNGQMDSFMLSIFAGLAQRERELISIRTRQALQAKKARGIKLGKPENFTNSTRALGRQSLSEKAGNNRNIKLAVALVRKCKNESKSLAEIAQELNESGFRTSQNKSFHKMTVKRLMDKIV